MATNFPRPERSNGNGRGSLADRVRDRVVAVQRAQERRAGATRPKIGRKPRAEATPKPANASAQSDEVTALQSVFREFGRLHRQYRERTGEHLSAPLRAAVIAFKQEPSMFSLLAVAGFLDDLELLEQ